MQNFIPVVIDIYPRKILVRFIYSFVRKRQLKSWCFNFIASFWQLPPFQWKVSLKKLYRPLKVSIKMASGTFFRALQCFEDFETIFAFLLNLVTNSLFRSISVYAISVAGRRGSRLLYKCLKSWGRGRGGTNAVKNSGYFPACNAVVMLKIETRPGWTRTKGVAWPRKQIRTKKLLLG